MNISYTIQQIKQKLDAAAQIASRIEKSGTVHPIDVDSLLEEIRSAYNKVYQLGWEEEETAVTEVSSLAVVPKDEPDSAPLIKLPTETEIQSSGALILDTIEPELEVEKKLTPDFQAESIMEEEGPLAELDEPASPIIELQFDLLTTQSTEFEGSKETETTESKAEEESVIATDQLFSEQASVEESSFAEADSVEVPVAAEPEVKLSQPPISDLRTAMSINDKFLLSNKLFKGNGTDFNLSLNVLNGFENLTEAKNYLQTIGIQNNWDQESFEFQLLSELVERRYFRS
jgi:hypothetical protein